MCTQRSQFPGDFWITESTKSRENVFLRFYQELESLLAKGGQWDAEMCSSILPNARVKLAKVGQNAAQRSQFPGDFRPTQRTESRANMFLMFYQKLEWLQAKGGQWDAEMCWSISPNTQAKFAQRL